MSGTWTTDRVKIAIPGGVLMSRGSGNSARTAVSASRELP